MFKTKKSKQQRKRKGFTLIELIIVLAVMAIIAAIAIPNFTAVSENSKNKADVQSAETIERTVLMLVSDGTVKAEDKIYTLSFTSGKAVISDLSGDVKNTVEEALQELKAPQGIDFNYDTNGKPIHDTNKANNYYIKVTAEGKVSVTTKAESQQS